MSTSIDQRESTQKEWLKKPDLSPELANALLKLTIDEFLACLVKISNKVAQIKEANNVDPTVLSSHMMDELGDILTNQELNPITVLAELIATDRK